MPRTARFLIGFPIALVAVAALLLQPSPGVDATDFRPGGSFRLCDDQSAQAIPDIACTLNRNDSTTLDSLTGFDIASPDANFASTVAYTPSTYISIANDAALPDGAIVGELRSLATLGLINGGCFTQLLVDFTFVDATTDFITAGAVDPAKIITPAGPTDNRLINLAEDDGDWDQNGVVDHDGGPNGIPDGADGYPSYNAVALDPDGAGPTPPLQPRARYMGVTVVPKAASGTVVILQFAIFDPGVLRAAPGGGGSAASLGYASLTILQDPTAPPAGKSITDFCTPLATTVALDGATRDNACTPFPVGGDCAFIVTVNSVNFTVNLIVEGAPAGGEAGSTRFASLAVPAGGATANYVVSSGSGRGTDDGDNHENALDPCPKDNDAAWDPRTTANPPPGDLDGDGLPDSCDPNDATFGSTDEDGDDWPNRLDTCPLLLNGDTVTTAFEGIGSVLINVASTVGFPAAAGFEIDIDVGSIRERRTVTAIGAGTPGTFTVAALANNHLSPAAVAQIFLSNVNHGQADFDSPVPAVIPEGPRSDGLGPECDNGAVGTDIFSPTSAQGHYHKTGTVARICILSVPAAPEDDDADGVCDVDDPNDASADSDGDSIAVGEPEKIYVSVDATVSGGDTRKTAAASGLAAGFPAGSVVVCVGNFDCARPLLGFLATEKYSEDETVNSRYDVNECVYSDSDSSGTVSIGDRRLHVDVADVPVYTDPPFNPLDGTPNCNFPGGSIVAAGNADIGVGLIAFDADEKHSDGRLVPTGLTALDYRNAYQSCANRLSEDSDTNVDLADNDCLGAHFDTYDDCISAANTAPAGQSQTDLDADGVGDACDAIVDSDNNPSSDALERHIGTGLDTACARTPAVNDEATDAQPEDTNDDRAITAGDLSAIAGDIGKNVPPAPVRKDIFPEPAGDNAITAGDLSKVAGIIGFACSSQVPPL